MNLKTALRKQQQQQKKVYENQNLSLGTSRNHNGPVEKMGSGGGEEPEAGWEALSHREQEANGTYGSSLEQDWADRKCTE